MNQQSGPQDPRVFSYLTLRTAVGIIGLALPFVLAFGKILLESPGIQCSISDYYYTATRNVLVGSLCAIGVFLMSTKGYVSTRGYKRKDEIAGYLAGVFAIGVAFLPATRCMGATSLIGILHYSFAAPLFLTLAYFSLCLFTKTNPDKPPTRRKLKRNIVYRVCGYIILACIFVIGVAALPPIKKLVDCPNLRFWLESATIVAFGVAWLTKGEAILKDEEAKA